MSEIFLSVFNTAVTAGWLVLAVVVVRLLLKNAPAWTKCALWAVVALRLVWPFELESMLSLVPSTQTLPPTELTASAPQIHTGIYAMNSAINPTFTQTFTPAPEASVNPLQIVVTVASALWIIGMVAMAVYALISYLRLRRRVVVSAPVGEGVYLCDTISSPFILGLLKPKIYLPSNLPREQWDAILSHERAHLTRRDHWWKPLGFALLTVFWFHPLLWVAYVLLCRDVELACDEKVIKSLSPEEKQAYSQTLLECSISRKWITACPLAFGETSVKQRIKAVLHYKKPALWIVIAALIICSALAVCFLTDPLSDRPSVSVTMLFDRDLPDSALQGEVKLEGFRDVSVRWSHTPNLITSEENPVLVKSGKEQTLFADYRPPSSLYVADITGDGKPDLCADVYYHFSGLPSFNAVCVYDIAADCYYLLDDRPDGSPHESQISYSLRMEQGRLLCDKTLEYGNSLLSSGTLFITESGQLQMQVETELDPSNKQYVYTKPGAGSDFYINIYADGTFQYYAGRYSSHIGLGDWKLKNGKLYLYDTTLTNSMTFVFSVHENALAYIAAESNPFMYVQVDDGDIFALAGEIGELKTNLLWVEVVEQGVDYIIGSDSEGNRWRILLTNDMIRCDLENTYGGIWVKYDDNPKQLDTTNGNERYEVTALYCWRYVEDDTLQSRENLRGWVYDYCLYDVDKDGNVEECIISMGHTSGIFTIHYSVWQDGACEEEKSLYTEYALGYAFAIDESGLFILSSEGKRIYPGLYSNGFQP